MERSKILGSIGFDDFFSYLLLVILYTCIPKILVDTRAPIYIHFGIPKKRVEFFSIFFVVDRFC